MCQNKCKAGSRSKGRTEAVIGEAGSETIVFSHVVQLS